MLTSEQLGHFHRAGFVLVPSVLGDEGARRVRASLLEVFDKSPLFKGDNRNVRVDVFARHPPLRWLLVHPPIVSALRSLLGNDFVYVREIGAHDTHFGGWHKDTTTLERAGHRFHLEPDFLMVQAVLYLQDNGPYGGGLDVIPGSHRTLDPYVKHGPLSAARWRLLQRRKRLERVTRALLRPVKKSLVNVGGPLHAAGRSRDDAAPKIPLNDGRGREGTYSIPSRAGDLVLFDLRLDHKASWPEAPVVPPDHRKLGLFFVCSSNSHHVAPYKRFLRSRADYWYIKTLRYPDEFMNMAEANSVTLG